MIQAPLIRPEAGELAQMELTGGGLPAANPQLLIPGRPGLAATIGIVGTLYIVTGPYRPCTVLGRFPLYRNTALPRFTRGPW